MVDNVKKKRLKTGLDILLGSEKNGGPYNKGIKQENTYELYINDIKPNVNQPRTFFNHESIKGLANSIKEQGLLMPILVREDENKESDSNNTENKKTDNKIKNKPIGSVPLTIKNTS